MSARAPRTTSRRTVALVVGGGLALLLVVYLVDWQMGRAVDGAMRGYSHAMDWIEGRRPGGAVLAPAGDAPASADAPATRAAIAIDPAEGAPSTPPTAPDAAASEFWVRVTDAGHPVEGADVWWHEAGVRALGATEVDGRVAVPGTPLRATFHARDAEGRVGSAVFEAERWDGATPHVIELAVEDGVVLRGRVRHGVTHEPFAGALVLAYGLGDGAPWPSAWWSAPLSPGRGAWTRSDASGAFELRGLAADATRWAIAAGRGHASERVDVAALDAAGELVLDVLPVFGARFEFVDASDDRALPATALGIALARVGIAGPPGATHLERTLAVDHLLAEAGTRPWSIEDAARVEGFWRLAIDEPDPIAVTVEARVAGYARAIHHARAARLDRALGVERVPLGRATDIGTLVVRVDGLDGDASALAKLSLGKLVVVGGGSDGRVLELMPPAARTTFELPRGTYSYQFEADGGRFRVPDAADAEPPTFEISDTPAEIVIEWPARRASIEVVLRDAAGRPYQGPLSLGCAREAAVVLDARGAVASATASPVFAFAPPYRIHDLRPGRYWVWLDMAVEDGRWVDVAEDATATVEFVR